jgi:acetolactate decarboxylase
MPLLTRNILYVTALALCGCGSPPSVEQYGAMREVLREGRTQPRIALQDVTRESGAIAVGALAGLGGEITIVNGETWVARSTGGGVEVTGPNTSLDDQATLLTASHVASWIDVPLPAGGEGRRLEEMVAEVATEHGIDATKPFPFIIDGQFIELDIHVIAGSCPIANPNGEPPWRYAASTPIEGLLVGFHARDQAGVMTHHGSNVHFHALIGDQDEIVTGHVDRVVVAPGAVLRLPSVAASLTTDTVSADS